MKKYFQIIFVSSVFFIIVFVKDNIRFKEDDNIISPTDQTIKAPVVISVAPQKSTSNKKFKDGTYTGNIADAHYGNVQVQATIQLGEISSVSFLEYPGDNRTSEYINSQAMPILESEAISIQDSQVDIVSGASHTSLAFRESLASALSQAK